MLALSWPKCRATTQRRCRCWRTCLVSAATLGKSDRHRGHRCRPCLWSDCKQETRSGAGEGEREALKIFQDLGDRRGEAISLAHLGQISLEQGSVALATMDLEQCLAIAREIKNQETEGECLLLLGEVALETDDWTQAALWFKRSLTVCREAADKRGESNALRWLGKCDLKHGDTASARNRLSEALRAFRTFEMWDELAWLSGRRCRTGLPGRRRGYRGAPFCLGSQGARAAPTGAVTSRGASLSVC